MTKRDIPALVRISKENMAHIIRSAWGTEWKDDILLNAVTDPDTVTEIATHEDTIVGYYTILKRIDSVFIVSIQILHQYQQRGLGSLMMSRIEEWGKRNGLRAVELWVQSTNEAAINFYEHLGYRLAGKQGNNYLMRNNLTERSEAGARGCHVGTYA
ncbi:MAG: GNAT family N-acetyltransferase [Methanomassiliicoccales archaeon]|nr:GNAT family N-acetyltransferase [Methanomassiliicoccales archaeon]